MMVLCFCVPPYIVIAVIVVNMLGSPEKAFQACRLAAALLCAYIVSKAFQKFSLLPLRWTPANQEAKPKYAFVVRRWRGPI